MDKIIPGIKILGGGQLDTSCSKLEAIFEFVDGRNLNRYMEWVRWLKKNPISSVTEIKPQDVVCK